MLERHIKTQEGVKMDVLYLVGLGGLQGLGDGSMTCG